MASRAWPDASILSNSVFHWTICRRIRLLMASSEVLYAYSIFWTTGFFSLSHTSLRCSTCQSEHNPVLAFKSWVTYAHFQSYLSVRLVSTPIRLSWIIKLFASHFDSLMVLFLGDAAVPFFILFRYYVQIHSDCRRDYLNCIGTLFSFLKPPNNTSVCRLKTITK